MATLNTLRTRGGVIVTIVIGLALLAFLLGDLSSLSSLQNSRKMRVGEIDGNKIGYLEYADQVDNLTVIEQMMRGKDALSTEEQEQVRDRAWDQLINEYALAPGFESMGIEVSEAEQVDMVSGTYISPVIQSVFANPQTRSFDPERLSTFVSNMGQDPSGRSVVFWNYIKDQMDRQRLMSKYMSLVERGMYVTQLEVEQSVAASNTVSAISYVTQDFASIADSTVVVSDSEIKKYYTDHPRLFRQNAFCDVEYVTFDVLPSAQDYADMEKKINEIAAEFEASDNPFQYAVVNSESHLERRFVDEKELPAQLAAYAFGPNSGKMYGPVLENETYTLARVAETKMLPDSIGARHIILPPDQTATADSILTALKGGASFAELVTQYSQDPQTAANGGDLGVFSPDHMIPEFSEAAMKAEKGDYFIAKSQYGIQVGQLTYKSPATKKVLLAQITYKIEPSEATQQAIYGAASTLVTASAGTFEGFKKAATDEALAKRVARIYNTDRSVSGLTNSREMVRWAFSQETGAVSQIMEINGDYVVAALANVAEPGTAPLESVKDQVMSILRTEKKGVILAEKMKGSSVVAVASQLGIPVKEAQNIDFNTFYIDGVGMEPALIGAVTAVKPAQVSKPVVGNSGVFLFDVVARENLDMVTVESEKVRLQTAATSYISERISQALMEKSDVKDNRIKFF